LLKKAPKKAPPPEQDTLVHLVWLFSGLPEQVDQLVLTAPMVCLKTQADPFNEPELLWLDDSQLDHAHVETVFRLGRTLVRLDELQNLEPGDVMVLEQSRLNQWDMQHPAQPGKWIPARINLPEKVRQLPPFPPIQGIPS
jgi:hypothetical protein